VEWGWGMGLGGSSWGGPGFGLEAGWPPSALNSRTAGGDNLDCLDTWTCSLMEVVGWEWESGC
jgi:hypothetical protein